MNQALREVVRRQRLKEFADRTDRIGRGEFRAPTPEQLAEMRKPRTF